METFKPFRGDVPKGAVSMCECRGDGWKMLLHNLKSKHGMGSNGRMAFHCIIMLFYLHIINFPVLVKREKPPLRGSAGIKRDWRVVTRRGQVLYYGRKDCFLNYLFQSRESISPSAVEEGKTFFTPVYLELLLGNDYLSNDTFIYWNFSREMGRKLMSTLSLLENQSVITFLAVYRYAPSFFFLREKEKNEIDK